MESRNLEGALEKTGQAVILDGDVGDCARFSLWLRSLIAPEYPLFFYEAIANIVFLVEAFTSLSLQRDRASLLVRLTKKTQHLLRFAYQLTRFTRIKAIA
jgi:hypothetical protein